MKEVMSSLMDKQDRLRTENTELRLRLVIYEKVIVINQGLKEMQEIKNQNDNLKATSYNYEISLRSLQKNLQDGMEDRI
ncbi:hypothetical protein E2C01_022664 [Portunus trituberculatus]|uniref:Uncharacterized protein n=1 Tax=Portunus trituberculatus TaxID=210409 RepID=A0A5B7E9H2_PORTR|nr:hypothetical protein [Portunus trituberculatus]